jgi:hypothetical protein
MPYRYKAHCGQPQSSDHSGDESQRSSADRRYPEEPHWESTPCDDQSPTEQRASTDDAYTKPHHRTPRLKSADAKPHPGAPTHTQRNGHPRHSGHPCPAPPQPHHAKPPPPAAAHPYPPSSTEKEHEQTYEPEDDGCDSTAAHPAAAQHCRSQTHLPNRNEHCAQRSGGNDGPPGYNSFIHTRNFSPRGSSPAGLFRMQ